MLINLSLLHIISIWSLVATHLVVVLLVVEAISSKNSKCQSFQMINSTITSITYTHAVLMARYSWISWLPPSLSISYHPYPECSHRTGQNPSYPSWCKYVGVAQCTSGLIGHLHYTTVQTWLHPIGLWSRRFMGYLNYTYYISMTTDVLKSTQCYYNLYAKYVWSLYKFYSW